MAELRWGQIYYKHTYAGILKQEPGERYNFTYDPAYVSAGGPAIAWTLPLREEPHISQNGLHPFFDNLAAEGWMEEAQSRLLGKPQACRFELLLAFGQDCAGAVSVRDPSPAALDQSKIDMSDPKQIALLASRASLSGVQPKFALIEKNGKFYPSRNGELSTHIAKFASDRHSDLVMNEYLTMQAFKALLPQDDVADVQVVGIEGFSDPVLIIKRFDRTADGARVHFEEFNQLLGRAFEAKYDGGYKDIADFIHRTEDCLPVDTYRLYLRILAGLLLGNTDMHFKNFAMFHTSQGLRMTPSYDQVAAALYGYRSVALAIGNARDASWTDLKAKSIIRLGKDCGLADDQIKMAWEHLAENKDAAADAITAAGYGTTTMKDELVELVKKRWNGTFDLVGHFLSKR